jgi:adenosylmethionine-8-amino-7-oxononanoate aminotransferase
MSKHSHVFHRKHKHAKPVVSHGQGIYLWDTTGKRYIDASGGAVVVNVGHGVAEIADAIREQAAQVAYAHATMFTSQALEELADRLATHMPMPDARLFFLCTGSDATETAVKFARQMQVVWGQAQRYKVIARWGSYHGLTMGALAITGKPSMRRYFEPLFVDMPHIPPPYCYRCPFGLIYPDCGLRCAEALGDEIKHQGQGTVAAFIAEPLAGATLGAVVPPPEYWPRVREICDQYGLLLIADEVMTGMGRTGHWFAIEQWDVTPDVICLGKGVSGGYLPLSVTAVRGDLVDLMLKEGGDFNHGGTFSHQPVAAAAGLAAVCYLEDHNLISHAQKVGEQRASCGRVKGMLYWRHTRGRPRVETSQPREAEGGGSEGEVRGGMHTPSCRRLGTVGGMLSEGHLNNCRRDRKTCGTPEPGRTERRDKPIGRWDKGEYGEFDPGSG